MAQFDSEGRQIPDTTPVVVRVRPRIPVSEVARLQQIIATEISRRAEMEGEETFEEANDFDCGDDHENDLPISAAEYKFMEEEQIAALVAEEKSRVREQAEGDSKSGSGDADSRAFGARGNAEVGSERGGSGATARSGLHSKNRPGPGGTRTGSTSSQNFRVDRDDGSRDAQAEEGVGDE